MVFKAAAAATSPATDKEKTSDIQRWQVQ